MIPIDRLSMAEVDDPVIGTRNNWGSYLCLPENQYLQIFLTAIRVDWTTTNPTREKLHQYLYDGFQQHITAITQSVWYGAGVLTRALPEGSNGELMPIRIMWGEKRFNEFDKPATWKPGLMHLSGRALRLYGPKYPAVFDDDGKWIGFEEKSRVWHFLSELALGYTIDGRDYDKPDLRTRYDDITKLTLNYIIEKGDEDA